ncbi:PEGA domain-containing protein [Patescibacteria group bacterium]|nr:PEGA domain-containing protein [Patescibacteria group bacterium]
MNRRLLITLSTAIVLIAGTYAAIQFAKGYRPNLQTREIQGTGLLVLNSTPKGAQVLIDGKLTTATDDTINLPPGEYEVEIKKDGYISWKKTLTIQAELVRQANARLFPAVTDLRPLTFTGAKNLSPSPDGQKIIYAVTQSSEEVKKGLWILDLVERPLSLSKEPRQIARNTESLDFTRAILGWSPDSNQVLTHFSADEKTKKSLEQNILLDASDFNRQESLRDATARLPLVFSQWEEQLARKINDQLLELPLEMQKIATASATNLYFSPDDQKLMYTATREVEIPKGLIPPLPSTSTQRQERSIKPGSVYVYDIKEDTNFLILETSAPAELGEPGTRMLLIDQIIPRTLFTPEASPSAHTKLQEGTTAETIAEFKAQYTPITTQSLQWFPDSNHLILTEEGNVSILEYDGTNRATIYTGQFENQFAYPWPDGSKLLILTNLNVESDLPPNIYAIKLK